MRTFEIELFGQVQGVGCRAYVMHTAKKLKVKGWVKNDGKDEGKVIVHAQAREREIKELVTLLEKGWHPICVREVKVREIEEEEHEDFSVRY